MPVGIIQYLDDGGDPPVRTGITVYGTGNPENPNATTLYTDISGPPGTAAWITAFAKHLQDQIDYRIPLDDPELEDDPDALEDPERENFFHDSGDLVARSVIVEVEWDDDQLRVKLHKAKNR